MTGSKSTSDEICPLCQSDAIQYAKPLKTMKDTLLYLDHFRNKRQEYFVCLSLDGSHHVIARRIVTVGLLNVSLAHPREVFAGPLTDRAASIIVAHNHPSGEALPSREDIKTTQQLVAAGILLGMPIRDHIIVAHEEHYSFKQNYLI
jgi:DNA repair protein RadC